LPFFPTRRSSDLIRKPVVSVLRILFGPVSVDMIVARINLACSSLHIILQGENEKAGPICRRWNAGAGKRSARDVDAVVVGAVDAVVRVPLLIYPHEDRINRVGSQLLD